MSRAGEGSLRVALLHHSYGSPPACDGERIAGELARALRDAGHRPHVLSSHRGAARRSADDGVPVLHVRRLPEAPLRLRGFAGPLTQLPGSFGALLGGDFDVAHAFSPPDALAALGWRRLSGRPVVFTFAAPIGREELADRRLRLWLLSRALGDSDAVTVPDEEGRRAVSRWLALDPPVLEAHDARAHEGLYRELLSGR